MAPSIRLARPEDAAGIARVHVDSWRSTYKDMISDELLANLSYERRAQGWKEILKNSHNNGFVYVAENEPGEIVGFVSAGPGQAGEPEFKGEVYAIYLLQQFQGKGLGRMLMEAAIKELQSRGVSSMLLWVLKDNLPSCRFYEALGGRYVKEKPIKIGEQTFTEVAYGWKDLPGAYRIHGSKQASG